MIDRDPLEHLLTGASLATAEVLVRTDGARDLELLGVLEERLAQSKTPKLEDLRSLYGLFSLPTPFPAAELRRAEEVVRKLREATGNGKPKIEAGLLERIAAAADLTSLPFFHESLAYRRSRDQWAPERKRSVVAALCFLAWKTKAPAAREAAEALLAHEDTLVRFWAVDGLARTHWDPDAGLSAELLPLLERVAIADPATEPRYLARRWLFLAKKLPAPEPAGGVYVFEAKLGKASRTVELRSEQSLGFLVGAILDAFGFDAEHLHLFTLSELVEHPALRLPSDEEFELGFDPLGAIPFEDEEEEEDEEGDEELTDLHDAPVGSLGLLPGHAFQLLYDFGDSHRFALALREVREKARAGVEYPRVAAKSGRAPRQYPA